MRCDDVIRELAVPTDSRDLASLADHLNHCPSCAAWAERAARLDRLWQVTQPAEPTSGVWDNIWAQVASSLDVQAANGAISPAVTSLRNGLASGAPLRFAAKPSERPLTRPFRSRRWTALALVGLAQAAAVLLVVGMSWRFFVPSRPPQNELIASLPSVDIEEGHLVMIVADPKLLSVVDLTPKTTTAGVDHVDWYGDEKYFDWFQVYHEVESLAKPSVAMK
jgi:hypothetical protein